MNDFTKEELELIFECVDADFYKTNWSRNMYEVLINKIQCMIDNYCEHDWENICCQCEMDNIYCHKCQRTFK